MTVVTFTSIKGAPGVTTLACLVGATWPDHRQVAVVESDPFGGDLAARFGLSAKRGWPTFAAASRRSGSDVQIAPHLQQLPGGLDVLVEVGAFAAPVGQPCVADLIDCSASSHDDDDHGDRWDLLVDSGRLLLDRSRTGEWLDSSDTVVVVVRGDAPSLLKVGDRSDALRARCGQRVSLIVVGGGAYDDGAIEQFTGIPVIGRVPFDPATASVAAGEAGGSHRLSRSLLVASARRLALTLAAQEGGEGSGPLSRGPSAPRPAPSRALESARTLRTGPSSTITELAGWPGRAARHLRHLRHHSVSGQTSVEIPEQAPSSREVAPTVESTHQQVKT